MKIKEIHRRKIEQHLLKTEIAYNQKSKDKAHAATSENCVKASLDL